VCVEAYNLQSTRLQETLSGGDAETGARGRAFSASETGGQRANSGATAVLSCQALQAKRRRDPCRAR
jgi:hypothetical protein